MNYRSPPRSWDMITAYLGVNYRHGSSSTFKRRQFYTLVPKQPHDLMDQHVIGDRVRGTLRETVSAALKLIIHTITPKTVDERILPRA